MDRIRVGIAGYGNLGRGVELAVGASPDMELVAVFTRRASSHVGGRFVDAQLAAQYVGSIDVMILCLGSLADLPSLGPHYASLFNTVDSYDNHSQAANYYEAMDKAAGASGNTSGICLGWDPGLFSLWRNLLESVLPSGVSETFWGPGVSLGHSDALRRIPGVKQGVQYTLPIPEAADRARRGDGLSAGEKHRRACYVVVEEGADKQAIAQAIKTMPGYFHGYDTSVAFVDAEELAGRQAELHHGGFVLRAGKTGVHHQGAEFSLKLESNPEFTGSVLVAYARAVFRLSRQGSKGAKTVLDIPATYLSTKTPAQLIGEI